MGKEVWLILLNSQKSNGPPIATDHDGLDPNTTTRTQVQPALASRTAETEYLENLSEKLLPLLLKGQHMR